VQCEKDTCMMLVTTDTEYIMGPYDSSSVQSHHVSVSVLIFVNERREHRFLNVN